jgi:GT2 family glycosyltransferase
VFIRGSVDSAGGTRPRSHTEDAHDVPDETPTRATRGRCASVSAVALAYNGASTLPRVLDALVAQELTPARTIVVDNASTDGTADVVRRDYPWVELHGLVANVGVGAGHTTGWNAAFADPACRFVWVLEHDTYPEPDCLRRLVEAVDDLTRRGVQPGVVACRLERDERERDARAVELRGVTGTDHASSAPRAMRRFTFNGVLVSRETFADLGGPRADFFVGQEDWDYAERMRAHGLGVYLANDAVALHPTKGDGRFGVRPGVVRSYYANRNWLFLRQHEQHERFALLRCWAWTAGACAKTILREDDKLRRVAARVTACADATLGRLGPRDYWFLRPPAGPAGRHAQAQA